MFNTTILTNNNNLNTSLDKALDNLTNVDYNTFYRAKVVDNNDPLHLGRVRIRITALHGNSSKDNNFVPNMSLPWATSAIFSGAGNDSGSYIIPNVGDTVFVTFENGVPSSPIYFGGVLYKSNNGERNISSSNINNNASYKMSSDDLDKDVKHNTERVIYKSLKGATIIIDDYDEEEYIKIVDQAGQEVSMQNYSTSMDRRGNKFGLSEKSKITMTNSQGDKITLKNGKTYIQSDSLVIEARELDIPGYNRDFAKEAALLDELNGETVIDYDSTTDSNAYKYQTLMDKILGKRNYTALNKNIINEAISISKDVLVEGYSNKEQIDFSDEMLYMSESLSNKILG